MGISVLGTGLMGAPMARRLLAAGHAVSVWNRTRDKALRWPRTVRTSPTAPRRQGRRRHGEGA